MELKLMNIAKLGQDEQDNRCQKYERKSQQIWYGKLAQSFSQL